MTDYFLMRQEAVNPVKPVLLKAEEYAYRLTAENFEKMPRSSAGYYDFNEYSEFPGIMVHPTYMVNMRIKKVIEMYDETIKWKSVTIMPNDGSKMKEASEVYWIPKLREFDCFDKETVIMPDGTIKRLVIRRDKVQNSDIFQISRARENKVVVSLRMAESICRRNIYGVRFERIEVG